MSSIRSGRGLRRITTAALLLCCAWAATSRAHENNPGMWAVLSLTDRLGGVDAAGTPSRWRYWFDGQYRAFDIGSGISQTVLRPAIGYDLGNNVSVWIGYGFFENRRSSGERLQEHRPWQQLSWRAWHSKRGVLDMRLRLGQRKVDPDVGDDLGVWLRYRVRYAHDLGRGWKGVTFLEPFIDLVETDWAGDTGPRQNRIFLGFERTLTPRTKVEFGYLHQYLWLDDRENLSNHLALLNLKTRF